MLLTVMVIWLVLAAPAAVLVAAVGRNALREDEALERMATAAPLVAADRSGHAALHDG